MVASDDFETKVKELEEWIMSHKWLPEKIEHVLVRRYLHSMNNNLEEAKTLIEHSYMLRSKSPHIFYDRDPLSETTKKIFQLADIGVPMPSLTPRNHRIIFNRLIDHDAEKFDFDAVVKTFFMVADYRFSNPDDQMPLKVNDGDVPIFDMTGFSYRHVTKLSFSTLRCYMKFTQEAFPMRLVNVHLINVSPVLSKVLTILRPFMKAKVREMMKFHTPNSTSLFDYVPQEILPNEYGGKAGNISDIKRSFIKELETKREYLMNDNNYWKLKDGNNNCSSGSQDMNLHTLSID